MSCVYCTVMVGYSLLRVDAVRARELHELVVNTKQQERCDPLSHEQTRILTP